MDYLDQRTESMMRLRFQLSYEFPYTQIQQNQLVSHQRKVRRFLPSYNVSPSTGSHGLT